MKILLLSDVPPCRNFTAGLVLDQLCRFLPRGSIACFAPVNPNVKARLTPDLDFIPIAYTHKRNEQANRRFPRPFTALGAAVVESLRRTRVVPRLIVQAEKFARQQRVDRIWAVLQGQTLIQMAPVLADRLGLPLYTQVWDPLSWWLMANKIDPHNAKRAHYDFENALRKSRACATASWTMAEEYQRRFGTRCVPLISSHSPEIAQRPDLRAGVGDTVRIGIAGQFYAGKEWAQLICALNFASWKIHGKSVSITVAGPQEPPHDAAPGCVRYVGWQSQADAARILSECDILYCPYPFSPAFAEVSRLSFPSKLVLYFCAGRPVLFHGPEYSSPYRYLKDRDAGVCVADSHAAAIYNGLSALVDDAELYSHIGENGQRAFMKDFTLDTMRTCFFNFLGISDREAAEARAESASLPLTSVPIFLPDVRAISPILAWARRYSPPRLGSAKSKRRLDSLQRQLDSARRMCESMRSELDVARGERDSMRSERDVACGERDSMRSERDVARGERDSMRSERDVARGERDSMRSERDLVRSELDQTLGKLHYAKLEENSALGRILARVTLLEERLMSSSSHAAASGQASSLLGESAGAELYLDLLEACLTGTLTGDPSISPFAPEGYNPEVREIGRDWPKTAETMIGRIRMRNLRQVVRRVLRENVCGDFMETGVWRGGACIYMRGILKAYAVTERRVWVADSFCGLPKPDEAAFPADAGDVHHTYKDLAVSLEDVKANFAKYNLLDDQVHFLKGWFKDTLPTAPIEKLAVLRLDGDMYESTIEALEALYDRMSPGGFVIIDDYILPACKKAVDDYRGSYNIAAPLEDIDAAAALWRVP